MKRFLKMIKEKGFCLIVSLPENSVNLAKAAQRGGADALKVHINVEHQASKTKFGSFKEEEKDLKKIISAVSIPVGIMPGAQRVATEKEMEKIISLGFDFFDVYSQHAPLYLLKSKIGKMIALNHTYNLEEVERLGSLGAEALEASIIMPSGYGKRLNLNDLAKYSVLVKTINIPVIVPTQREIHHSEVPRLKEVGVKGIMIGAVVTGKKEDSIEKKTREFRKAVDKISKMAHGS